ncbi:MAG: TetR/AcrR family transcriptional regulator [Draconibacterium sp.]
MKTQRSISKYNRDIIYRRALLKAVGKILKRQGHAGLGINVVAEEAGVDKTFIYRRYGSFEGLLKAYVEKQDFWFDILKKTQGVKIEDHRAFMKQMLTDQFHAIYKNPEFQQFLVWELGDKDNFTTGIAIEREELANDLIQQVEIALKPQGINLNIIYAVLIAGIYYLTIHKGKSTFCGIDITQKEDVQEFEQTLEWLIDVIFNTQECLSEKEQTALRAFQKGLSVDDIAYITQLSPEKILELTDSN